MRKRVLFPLMNVAILLLMSAYQCLAGFDNPIRAKFSIPYGEDTVRQSMDVFLPLVQDTDRTPVIVLVHGGAWYFGDKTSFSTLGFDTFLTEKGYAVVSINYRLVSNAKYPAQIEDIGMVMDYIKDKGADWKINPDRVCILGMSSGAQLALIYAYCKNKDGRIKAAIDLYGPTNLLDSTVVYSQLGGNAEALLGPIDSNREAWHDASPLFYTKTGVPTAIVQGPADSIVYFKHSKFLEDSLKANNIPVILYKWVAKGHGWHREKWMECREPMMAWIRKFL